MRKYLSVWLAVAALVVVPAAHATSPNVLIIDPDPGEALSGGIPATFAGDDSTFAARDDGSSVFVGVDHISPTGVYEGWQFQFAAPLGQPLQVGTYTDIARAPFRAWGQAGWDATHMNTWCNTVSGSFTVNQFTYGPLTYLNGGYYYRVNVFDADWKIYCGNETPGRPNGLAVVIAYALRRR
jgi:hypothetical protein